MTTILQTPNDPKYSFFQCIDRENKTECVGIDEQNYYYVKGSELLFLRKYPFASRRFDSIRLKLAFNKHQVTIVDKLSSSEII